MKKTIAQLARRYPNVLVTGGAGTIGGNLLAALCRGRFKKMVVIDNLSSGHWSNLPVDRRLIFIKGDIADARMAAAVV